MIPDVHDDKSDGAIPATRQFMKKYCFVVLIVTMFIIGSSFRANAQVKTDTFRYTYPLVPVWTVGDDTSAALVKPTMLYKELPGTRVIIPNMPAFRNQGVTEMCRAFSLAVIIQKYTCDVHNIADCAHPPADEDISYFGMSYYTNQIKGVPNTFDIVQDEVNSIDDIIVETRGSGFIRESCMPSEKLSSMLGFTGPGVTPEIVKNRGVFFAGLEELYDVLAKKNAASIEGIQTRIDDINRIAGLHLTVEQLDTAVGRKKDGSIFLRKFNGFLSKIFFSGCRRSAFPGGYLVNPFPVGITNATAGDVKNKMIEVLKIGKPILFPSLCLSKDVGYNCKYIHSLVIAGYKEVCDPKKKTICRELFKVHNSWGELWQKQNSNGWVDADALTGNTVRVEKDGKYYLTPSAILWLEP